MRSLKDVLIAILVVGFFGYRVYSRINNDTNNKIVDKHNAALNLFKEQKYQEALNIFEECIKSAEDRMIFSKKNLQIFYENRAIAKVNLFQYDSALDDYKNSKKIKDTPESIFKMGEIYFYKGDFEKMGEQFELAKSKGFYDQEKVNFYNEEIKKYSEIKKEVN